VGNTILLGTHLSQCLVIGECHSAVIQAMDSLDLSKVLPLGRQHGILNSLEIVLKNISHLISEYLPKILQILLCMTATVSHILDQREKVRDSEEMLSS
jgi:U3 small nucleolar RNA-associated protein 20